MDQQSIDLRGVLNVFRRRFKFIFAFVFLILLITTVVLFSITPRYTATSKLLLDVTGKSLFDPDSTVPSTALANAIIDTEVEIIRSTPVLLKTFQDLNLLNTDEYGAPPSPLEKALQFLGMLSIGTEGSEERLSRTFKKFRENIAVKREGFTFIINVDANANSPQLASKIANAITQTHIVLKQDARDIAASQAQNMFEERIVATQTLKAAAQQKLEAFIPDNLDQLIQLDKDAQIPILRAQIADLEEKRRAFSNVITALNNGVDRNVLDGQTAGLLSEGLKSLIQQRQNLMLQIQANSNARPSEEQKNKLAAIDKQLAGLVTDDLSRLTKVEQDYAERINAARNDLTARIVQIAPASMVAELDALRVSANVSSDLYQRLVERGSELQVQTDIEVSDVRVTEEAVPPHFPSFPNKLLVLVLAGFAATGTAIGVAFVFDQYWGGITSDGQLADIISKRVGAVIPAYQPIINFGASKNNICGAMDIDPTSNFAEAIRRVRSEIDLPNISTVYGRAAQTGKTILVTSGVPNEGKSTIAISLAKSIAYSGARVILIDADFRKPALHKYLEIDGGTGLVEFLLKPAYANVLATSFRKQVIPNLDVLVGQGQLGQPSDILGSSVGFDRLIGSVVTPYDYVVIDTPPLLPVVDASYLLRHADAAVFVVGFAKTSQQDVRKANVLLEKYLKSDTLVVPVLNKSDPAASVYA